MKLNTADFSKIHADKHHTVLKHKAGHELKIAHSSLSPKIKAQLAALPMASGGEVMNPKLSESKKEPHNMAFGGEASEHVSQKSKYSNGGNPTGDQYAMPTPAYSNFAEGGAVLKENYKDSKLHKYAEGGAVSRENEMKENQPRSAREENSFPYLRCQNPLCKSHGKPHPNCKCYSPLAEGGEVNYFCAREAKHKDDCHLALGGDVPKYADGDKVEPNPVPQNVVESSQDAPQELIQKSEEAPVGITSDMKGVAPVNPPASAADASEPPAPEEEQNAPPAEEEAPATPPKLSPKEEMDQEAAAHEHDLVQGHITPETYSSLFAKKDTLGKIGTVFGLLLGGIGSGLTGQPNALMSLMQKQIDNDLEAQKASAANAQNFLRINQQNKLLQSQGKKLDAESNIIATTNAANQATQSAFHSLLNDTKKLPEGPQKEMRKQVLGQLYAQMQGVIADRNDKAAGLISYSNMLAGGAGPEGASGEQQFQNQMKAWRMSGDPTLAKQADIEEARHIPGVPGKATRNVDQKDRDQIQAMNVLDTKASDLLNFAKKYKGTLSPSQRAVGEQKAEEMINFYNQSLDKGILTQGRLKWLDSQIRKHPTSIFQDILGNNARLSEIQSSNGMRKNLLLKSYGFPVSGGGSSQPQYKTVNGVKYMRGPNGEAIKVQ